MLQWLEISGIPPLNDVRIDFGERLTMITGDNGLGKSVILDAVHWMLTGVWPNEPIVPPGDARIALGFGGVDFVRDYDHKQGQWQWNRGRSEAPVFRLVTQTGTGGALVSDPERQVNFGWKIDSWRSFQFSREEVWIGTANEKVRECNGLIDDIVRWQATHPEVFADLQRLVETLAPPGEFMSLGGAAKIDKANARVFPLVRVPHGTLPVTHLSMGMQRILALAYMAIWSFDPDSPKSGIDSWDQPLIIIVDEIDAHLHPKWQRSILSSLIAGLKGLDRTTKIQVVVTAHAPMILAGFEVAADPAQDRIATVEFLPHARSATISSEPWAKLGTADEWLTSSVFGLTDTGSIERERAINDAVAFLDQPNGSSDDKARIEEALKAALPGLDPFWSEWRWGLAERGL